MIDSKTIQAQLEKQKISNSEQERILHNLEVLERMEPQTDEQKLLNVAQENKLSLPDNFGEMYQAERRFLPQLKEKFSDNSTLMQKQATLAVYAYQQEGVEMGSFTEFLKRKVSEGKLDSLSQEILQNNSRLDLMRLGLLVALAAASRRQVPQNIPVEDEERAPERAEVSLPQNRSVKIADKKDDKDDIAGLKAGEGVEEQVTDEVYEFQKAQLAAKEAQEKQKQQEMQSTSVGTKAKKAIAKKIFAGTLASLLGLGTMGAVAVSMEDSESAQTTSPNVTGQP